jgi:hypothetical protein
MPNNIRATLVKQIILFIELMFVAVQCANALDFRKAEFPLRYQCREIAVGGILYDKQRGAWFGAKIQRKPINFSLTILKFDANSPDLNESCNITLMAKGIVDDGHRKARRKLGMDLCMLLNIGLPGPVIHYCEITKTGSKVLNCNDPYGSFAFDTSSLTYFMQDSLTDAVVLPEIGEITTSTGQCKELP